MALELLLARADSNQPVLRQGIAEETLLGAPLPLAGQMPDHLWDVNHDSNDLSRQRWGIIAPKGEDGDKLLRLIEPLRRVREDAQGAPAHEYRISPEDHVVDGPSAMRWKQENFWCDGRMESSVPRYLLLLGDLKQIPLELQQVLSTDAFVGRLTFPVGEEDKYTAYVNKVLHWEETAAREKKARMLFYTAWAAKDEAIRSGYYGLVDPCIQACRQGQSMEEFPMAEILELGGGRAIAREQFLAQAAELGPGVLFSLSHGASGGKSPHERQGALMLPDGSALMGKDVASRPFLPGGIWFFFACYSAGTPARSSYEHWLSELDEEEARRIAAEVLPRGEPFIAALPQAVLANPNGPLAVIGHADLAWTYSFKDEGTPTHSRFMGVLKALAEGGRAGVALHALQRFVSETSVELSLLYNRREAALRRSPSVSEPMTWARLWMTRQDLTNYILLGDPAVRLPLGPSLVPDSLPCDIAEKAVLDLLSGRALGSVAARHRVSTRELRQWEEIFRAAGRAALGRHFSVKS